MNLVNGYGGVCAAAGVVNALCKTAKKNSRARHVHEHYWERKMKCTMFMAAVCLVCAWGQDAVAETSENTDIVGSPRHSLLNV